MAKYYAVFKGKSNKPLILNTWDECKNEVYGVKGAIYKSFTTLEEAQDYLDINSNQTVTKDDGNDANIGLISYVDGSFSEEKRNYSYGIVILKDGEVIYKENGVGEEKADIKFRNISGEVLAAIKAVEYAIKESYDEITIVHDYQGIASWAMGTWNRNNDLTRNYYAKMSEYKKKIKINFRKVKGHSGNKFNDMVDKLAKEALGII